MVEIGAADFLISISNLSQDELERYSSEIFDKWDARIQKTLMLPDYSISLEIEEGSIKGAGKIAAAVGALYLAIGNYGSFISGLQIIRGQVNAINDALIESAALPFETRPISLKTRKRTGVLSQLQKLFDKVQSGEITSEQAMRHAEKLLGDESKSSPAFMNELRSSLEGAPRFPKQIPLPNLDLAEENELIGVDKKRPGPPSHPKPIPLTQHHRVQIWRDSKNEKKNVRVTKF